VRKLTSLLLGILPLASQAHTGAGTEHSLLHSLHHGGAALPLAVLLVVGSSWLVYRWRVRS
jgi:hypothetical protein